MARSQDSLKEKFEHVLRLRQGMPDSFLVKIRKQTILFDFIHEVLLHLWFCFPLLSDREKAILETSHPPEHLQTVRQIIKVEACKGMALSRSDR